MKKQFDLNKMATRVATVKGLIKYIKVLYGRGASFRCIDKFVYIVKDMHKDDPRFDVMWVSDSHQCLGRQAHNGSYYGYNAYDWMLLQYINGEVSFDTYHFCIEDAESDYDADEEEEIISYQDTYYW